MHAKVFSIQIFQYLNIPIFPPNSAEGLHFSAFHFIMSIITDYGMALKFNFTAMYIDDLLSLNNTLWINEIPNIYPLELVLNRTSESDVHVSYLDINISIKQLFLN